MAEKAKRRVALTDPDLAKTSSEPRAKKIRERRCAASGEVKPEAELIRLAISPDGVLVPDVAAKLPGRGIWISAARDSVAKARKKGGYARAAGGPVTAPEDLDDQIRMALEARALSLLGLARRAGALATGFDAARLSLKAARPAWRVEASDGAADGREKLDRLARAAWGPRRGAAGGETGGETGGDIPVATCFSAETLGRALGKAGVVHAVLAEGPQARRFDETMRKLSGFRDTGSIGESSGQAG